MLTRNYIFMEKVEMNLRYSILMSVYYKEKPEWLDLSIKSMLNQTVKSDDFVIVKDGPLSKELDEVIEKYRRSYPDVFNVVSLKNNIGLGPALAVGIKECKNELIARMDSDDYSLPNRCEKQLKCFEINPNLDVVGCFESEFINKIDNVISIHKVPETSKEIDKFMRRRCGILHPTVIYKKSAVLKCGNYNDVPLYEDYDLFIRMMKNSCKSYNIQQSLYFIRINEDFYKRRGGIRYAKTVLSFKRSQYKDGYFSLKDYLVSGWGQAIVCLMPNFVRIFIYKNLLR